MSNQTQMHQRPFLGTGVALVTPFHADKSIDFSSLQQLVERMISGGIDYLVVLGTTGEVVTLSPDEQEQVIECVLEKNASRLPVVLGVGGNDTRKCCNTLEKWTSRYPIDGILSVSPYYNKPTQRGIYQHYRSLLDHTDLSIILYNVPGRTASNISAETTLKLAYDSRQFVAIKEASGNLAQGMEIVAAKPKDFLLISGDDLNTLPLMSVGGSGVISVIGNALPQPVSQMVNYGLDGEFERARDLHYQLLKLMRLIFVEGNPVGIKALMQLQGWGDAWVRQPLADASEELIETLKRERALIA